MYHGERFNSISHLVGAALALAGFVVLVMFAASKGDPWKIVSIYGTTLFLLYSLSTLDHVAIYLLIAGTYIPLTPDYQSRFLTALRSIHILSLLRI